jgi:hypothetical protein
MQASNREMMLAKMWVKSLAFRALALATVFYVVLELWIGAKSHWTYAIVGFLMFPICSLIHDEIYKE